MNKDKDIQRWIDEDPCNTAIDYHIKIMNTIELKGLQATIRQDLQKQLDHTLINILADASPLLQKIGDTLHIDYKILKATTRPDWYDPKTGFHTVATPVQAYSTIVVIINHAFEYTPRLHIWKHFHMLENRVSYHRYHAIDGISGYLDITMHTSMPD